jgi:hypothetical protein
MAFQPPMPFRILEKNLHPLLQDLSYLRNPIGLLQTIVKAYRPLRILSVSPTSSHRTLSRDLLCCRVCLLLHLSIGMLPLLQSPYSIRLLPALWPLTIPHQQKKIRLHLMPFVASHAFCCIWCNWCVLISLDIPFCLKSHFEKKAEYEFLIFLLMPQLHQ